MALRYVALAAALAAPTDPPDADNQPFWTGHPDAPTFERAVDVRLDRARDLLVRLVGVKSKRTVANTLVPYDQLMRELDRAASATGLIQKVHPDSAIAGGGRPQRPQGLRPRDRDLARPAGIRCGAGDGSERCRLR